jgi:hypothetical protein
MSLYLSTLSMLTPLSRVDLRPAPTRANTAETGAPTADGLPPPLEESTDPTARRMSRRQSIMVSLLNPRVMSNATAQERLAALRQVRQQRNAAPAEEMEARRRRRLTIRLQDVFSIRTTRNRPNSIAEASPTSPTSPISPLPHTTSVEAIPEAQEPETHTHVHEAEPPEGAESHQAEAISLASPESSPIRESSGAAEARAEATKKDTEDEMKMTTEKTRDKNGPINAYSIEMEFKHFLDTSSV